MLAINTIYMKPLLFLQGNKTLKLRFHSYSEGLISYYQKMTDIRNGGKRVFVGRLSLYLRTNIHKPSVQLTGKQNFPHQYLGNWFQKPF